MEASQPASTVLWPFNLLLRAPPSSTAPSSNSSGARARSGAAGGPGADPEESMPLVIDIRDSSSSSSLEPQQAPLRLPAPAPRDSLPSTSGRQGSNELPAPAGDISGSSSNTTISATVAAVAAELTGQGPVSRALLQQHRTTGASNNSSSSSTEASTSGIASSGGGGVGASQQGAVAEIAAAAAADGGETAAAAAERHRLTNPPSIDLAALASWLEQLLPFCCLLAVVFLWHHWLSVLVAAWLMGALIKSNQTVRSQVAQKNELALGELSTSVLYIVTNAAGVLWLMRDARLWRSFVLLPPVGPLTVWQTLFLVFTCDCLIRLIGLSVKLLLVAAHQAPGNGAAAWLRLGAAGGGSSDSSSSSTSSSSVVPSSSKVHFRQARALTFVEHVLMSYRALVPTPIWYSYLLTSTISSLLCSLLIGVYLTLKAGALMKTGRQLARAGSLLMSHGALYGSYVDKEELMEGGDVCPICQDSITTPIRLECNTAHVFCEDCISEWLERDQSCPMCRAKPAGPGLQIHSDGGTTLLPQLF